MSNDPERLIEKRLRACARKRREEAGAPFALHPATRQMLQGEVARHYRKPAPAPSLFAQWFARYGRRLAYATSLLAVLILGTWFFFPAVFQNARRMEIAAISKDKSVSLAEASKPMEFAKAAPTAGREMPAAKAMPAKERNMADARPVPPSAPAASAPAAAPAPASQKLLESLADSSLANAPTGTITAPRLAGSLEGKAAELLFASPAKGLAEADTANAQGGARGTFDAGFGGAAAGGRELLG